MADQVYREGQKARLKDGSVVEMRGGQWVPQGSARPDAVMRRQAAQALTKSRIQADQATRHLRDLDEFDRLNGKVRPTGGLISNLSIGARALLGSGDINRMAALSNTFALDERRLGSGSQSDRDLATQKSVVGGPYQAFDTNKRFVASSRQTARETIERQEFREAFLEQHGSLNGVEAAFVRSRLPKAPPAARRPSASSGWTITEVR